jgi:hypothetical protein
MKPITLTNGPFAGKTVELASQERIAMLTTQVERVLEAIGHPEALVTDESSVSDFYLEPNELEDVKTKLGVEVNRDDLIVDVATRLMGPQ